MKKPDSKNHLQLVEQDKRPPLYKRISRFLGKLLFVVLLLFLLNEGWGYFKVREIEVLGAGQLNSNEVIAASGVVEGKSIFMISEREAADMIAAKIPLARNVVVTRELPDKVRISFTERAVAAYVLSPNGYRLIDVDAFCFALSPDEPEGYPAIHGLSDELVIPGEAVKCKAGREALRSFFDVWPKMSLPEVKSLDLSDRHNLVVLTETNLEIWLGGAEEMETKLLLVRQTIPHLESGEKLRLDVRAVKRVVVSGGNNIDI